MTHYYSDTTIHGRSYCIRMTSIVSQNFTKTLCGNDGSMDFKQLNQIVSKMFTVSDSVQLEILRDSGRFAIREGREKASAGVLNPGSVVVAKTSLRVCQKPPGDCVQCDDLHLCRYYVCGNCRFGIKCKNSHNLDIAQNTRILRSLDLHVLGEAELFQLLLQNDPHLTPEICSHYNKGVGEHGSCKFKSSCTSLHICLHYLQGDCRFGSGCKRGHALDAVAMKILNGRGFSPENIRNIPKIYMNKLIILSHKEITAAVSPVHNLAGSPAIQPVGKQASRQPSSNSISESDKEEICLFFLRGHCSFKDKCVRLVPLSDQMEDHKRIQKLFKCTMPSNTIYSIKRIQNPSLWRVFQWQKEQMMKKNGGKPVDVRNLFHGTDQSIIEAICEQNFDWRACGVNGTVYGQGSYFARDASYSHPYIKSPSRGKKIMFVALVLVGEFTIGRSRYRRPPQKGSSKALYDSCVNSESNPSIFVVFEKQQIYPEFLIEYC
ncbi:hypothetical protein DPEC_G00163920 [Dallia pectoralis]|uniref:Uncharacterized protein n=1 Tax=Dallia pectoralis TaxID=75939 RepID=A0ACC2GGW9_DALPE|nr:hypothetical protein DPEC_G00163920 [Dallia pectoralis]